jgi:hypothetical protein
MTVPVDDGKGNTNLVFGTLSASARIATQKAAQDEIKAQEGDEIVCALNIN